MLANHPYEDLPRLPVIDLSLARSGADWTDHLAAQLDWAASEFGFFYVAGHGVDTRITTRLLDFARKFFEWPLSRKLAVHMKLGGSAWRGYFPVGGELTSGRPDLKEGLYLGEDLGESDARVAAGWPLHGRNVYPDLPGFDGAVNNYNRALAGLGHTLTALLARGLGLEDEYFRARYMARPTQLLRLFNYPAGSQDAESCGVGEHTDYGLLTLLLQDEVGGLEVRHEGDWLEVPYLPDSFVVNIGDMFQRLTGGRYTSALHRVVNRSSRARLSIPFFFDPAFDAVLEPVEGLRLPGPGASGTRWDGADPGQFGGTYGEYLIAKVARVFPGLSPVLRIPEAEPA